MTLQVNGTNVVIQNRSFVLGTATPAAPSVGMIRFNSTSLEFEVYSGVQWNNIRTILTPPPVAWAFGNGFAGGLGSGSTTNVSSPVTIVGGFTDWASIVAGYQMGAGIRANGQLWTWGNNTVGKLGNLSTTSTSSPVSVSGDFSDWVQVAMGNGHTVGLRVNGTVWAWGAGTFGRTGDGFNNNNSSPRSVSGNFSDWIQISAGAFHSVGLRVNGQAWSWGYNGTGSLGDGTALNRASPVSVVGGFTDWVQVASGGNSSAGIRSNGQAWTWGVNASGALGDNTITASRLSPVSVVGGFTDWVQISVGTNGMSAIRANGQAWCWGRNNFGQLGDNTITSRSSPVSVVGGISDWIQISSGIGHTMAIRSNGQAWGWGYNNSGRLGVNDITNRSSPVSVIGNFTDWVQISAGCGSFTNGARAT